MRRAMADFLIEDDWSFHQLEGKTILTMGLKAENGSWRCYAKAKEDQEWFIYHSVMGLSVPPEKR